MHVNELVDWELARRIAGTGIADRPAEMPGGVDLASAGTRSAGAVLAYTGLSIGEPLPEAEWVTRTDWAELNLRSMRELLEPVGARIGDLSRVRRRNARGDHPPGAGGGDRGADRIRLPARPRPVRVPAARRRPTAAPALRRREPRQRDQPARRPGRPGARLGRPPRGHPRGPLRLGAVAARLRRRPRPHPARRIAGPGPGRRDPRPCPQAELDRPAADARRSPRLRSRLAARAGRIAGDDQRDAGGDGLDRGVRRARHGCRRRGSRPRRRDAPGRDRAAAARTAARSPACSPGCSASS